MVQVVLAADFGGTYFRAALVDSTGTVVGDRANERTPSGATGAAMLDFLGDVLESVLARASERPVRACVGVPGLVDAESGRVHLAVNLPGFRNVDVAGPLGSRLGLPVIIENDASAAALGEHRFGAGRGARHLLHATLGTGIGGGIVIDGLLYRGANGLAGEIGHTVIDPAGPRCRCGGRGCLEAMVSGVAFGERAKRLVAAGNAPVLAELAAGRDATGVDLFAAATAGDALCEAEIRHGGHLLGLGLGGLVNVLNPDVVTLSGGLLVMGEMLLRPLRDGVASVAYGPASATQVKTSELGEDAGLLGAAAVALASRAG